EQDGVEARSFSEDGGDHFGGLRVGLVKGNVGVPVHQLLAIFAELWRVGLVVGLWIANQRMTLNDATNRGSVFHGVLIPNLRRERSLKGVSVRPPERVSEYRSTMAGSGNFLAWIGVTGFRGL